MLFYLPEWTSVPLYSLDSIRPLHTTQRGSVGLSLPYLVKESEQIVQGIIQLDVSVMGWIDTLLSLAAGSEWRGER